MLCAYIYTHTLCHDPVHPHASLRAAPPLRPLFWQKNASPFPNPPVLNLSFFLPRLPSRSCARTLLYLFPLFLHFLLVCFTLRVYVRFYACMCVMHIYLRWPCLCVCAKICVCGEGCLSNQSYRMCFAKKNVWFCEDTQSCHRHRQWVGDKE